MATKTAADILEECHFPRGLLPDTVTDYELLGNGDFSCTLSEVTYRTFGEGPEAKTVCYAKKLKGVLKDMSLTNLKGITTKKFFLWVGVNAIKRDTPTSTNIKFIAGPVTKELPVSWFEAPASS
eukprot:SM000954S24934  [mRNA]  locus=s954:318:1531:+ [translate_table: standard]